MKALSMRILAGTVALGALFYLLSCSPATQNNNSSQNQGLSTNQNQANVNRASVDRGPCKYAEPGTHGNKIKGEIKGKMGTSLKRLLKDDDNPNGTFTIEVKKATDGSYFIAYVRGQVSGDDNLKDLTDILNDFQDSKDCLRMVYFLPNQTTTLDQGDGFRWSSCEHPLVLCPNGECCMSTGTDPNPSPITNTGTNGNVNANRGGNTSN